MRARTQNLKCDAIHVTNLSICGNYFVQLQWLTEQIEYPENQKISCCSLDTNDQKMIDTSFERLECKLLFEILKTSKTVRLLDF